eukprot:1461539-Alexandrium_andersonii.AAC.1
MDLWSSHENCCSAKRGHECVGGERDAAEHAQMQVPDATLTQGLGSAERARHPEYLCTAGA